MQTFKTFKSSVIVPIIIFFLMIVIEVLLILTGMDNYLAYLIVIMSYSSIFIQLFYGAKLNNMIDITPSKKKAEEEEKYFQSLVENSTNNLKKYKKKLKLIAHSGDVYIALLIINIFLAAVSTIFAAIQLEIHTVGYLGSLFAALFGMLYIITTTFFIKVKGMDGNKIERLHNTEFFKIIDDATRITKSPKINHVYLVNGDNCGVAYTKVGSKYDNVIEIGIVLLELLNEDELKAIIVHELSHINHRDVKEANMVTKKSNKWGYIYYKLAENNGIAKHILGGFASAYVQFISIHMNALSKKKELEADLKTISYIDKTTFARALYKLEIFGNTNFYDGPMLELGRRTKPPKDYYDILFAQFYQKYEITKKEVKKKIVKKKSSTTDTHPSYYERMNAIGVTKFDFEIKFNKNEVYAKEVKELIKIINNDWCTNYADVWHIVRTTYRKNKLILDNYVDTNDVEKNLQYAIALEELNMFDDAVVVYDKIIKVDKNNSIALFKKAQLLLNRNDNKGIAILKKAIDLNKELIPEGISILNEYLVANGLDKKQEELNVWIKEKENIIYEITDELTIVKITDKFTKTSISKKELKKITDVVKTFKGLKKAFIVQKTIEDKGISYNIIALMHGLYTSNDVIIKNEGTLSDLLNKHSIDSAIFNLNENPHFVKVFSNVEEATIFSKNDSKTK